LPITYRAIQLAQLTTDLDAQLDVAQRIRDCFEGAEWLYPGTVGGWVRIDRSTRCIQAVAESRLGIVPSVFVEIESRHARAKKRLERLARWPPDAGVPAVGGFGVGAFCAAA
jgi:hypothetical protein